jgi:hypothetical protein
LLAQTPFTKKSSVFVTAVGLQFYPPEKMGGWLASSLFLFFFFFLKKKKKRMGRIFKGVGRIF